MKVDSSLNGNYTGFIKCKQTRDDLSRKGLFILRKLRGYKVCNLNAQFALLISIG